MTGVGSTAADRGPQAAVLGGAGPRLDGARRVLGEKMPGVRSSRSLAAVLLTRQALETAVEQYWLSTNREMAWVTDRAQRITLVSLFDHVDRDPAEAALGRDIAWAWGRLSHLCHHQAYEQNPSAVEVSALIDVVQRLVDHLESDVSDRDE